MPKPYCPRREKPCRNKNGKGPLRVVNRYANSVIYIAFRHLNLKCFSSDQPCICWNFVYGYSRSNDTLLRVWNSLKIINFLFCGRQFKFLEVMDWSESCCFVGLPYSGKINKANLLTPSGCKMASKILAWRVNYPPMGWMRVEWFTLSLWWGAVHELLWVVKYR